MHRGDRIRQLILQIIESADSPLETPRIVTRVQTLSPKTTRTIVFKRLTDMRGDQEILGKHVGSGKGTWIWWKRTGFTKPSTTAQTRDAVVNTIHMLLGSTHTPLETSEIVDKVRDAIPTTTRTIVMKRLVDLRGDQALKGQHIGSGKGTWIWWRNNAFEE